MKGKKILLLGPTGSGKGNRSKDLQALGLVHIGLGAILREKVRDDPDSELSQKVIETTKTGGLLKDEYVFPIILENLNRDKCHKQGFVLEGFPRTKAQADWLLSQINLDLALLLDVPKSFLIDGIIAFHRRSCVQCLATYSDFDPPRTEGFCDRCGGKLILRLSDSVERVKTRLNIFEKETSAFLPDLKALGILHVLSITVDNNQQMDSKYVKKLNGEVFWVQTDDGGKARMLNYDGMRIRLYQFLQERFPHHEKI